MAFGVTPTGFVRKIVEDLKQEIEDDEHALIDPGLNVQPDQPIGQINAIVSKKLAEVWELAEVAYNGFDRDAAEDRLLDNVGALTGTPRDPAKKSEVSCTVNLNGGFSAAPGTMTANVPGQDPRWVNKDAIGPVGSTGNYTLTFQAVDYGPVVANAGTLTQITAPVTGWNSITNATDAAIGSLQEKDAPYRDRQVDELTAAGSSTVDAIRADLLKVKGVLQAFVFENVGWTTDADGLPGKSYEAVIYDGASPAALDTDIAQAIWDAKPAGADTHGATSANATDKLGKTRAINFSRATIDTVYVDVDLEIDASKFPTDGFDLVKDAIVARGNELNLGDEVYALVLKAAALTVPGVKNVPTLRLALAPSPTSTTDLATNSRHIARFDTSRVTTHAV